MAMMDLTEYLKLAPVVRDTPHRYLWSSYDEEADTLYISFKKPVMPPTERSQTTT